MKWNTGSRSLGLLEHVMACVRQTDSPDGIALSELLREGAGEELGVGPVPAENTSELQYCAGSFGCRRRFALQL